MTIDTSKFGDLYGKPQKTTKLTIAIAIILTLLNMLIAPAVMGARFDPQRWGEFLGTLLGPILFGLFVVAVFQIGLRFRNQRSRWKIYCWTLAILLLANFSRIAQNVAQTLPTG